MRKGLVSSDQVYRSERDAAKLSGPSDVIADLTASLRQAHVIAAQVRATVLWTVCLLRVRGGARGARTDCVFAPVLSVLREPIASLLRFSLTRGAGTDCGLESLLGFSDALSG